MNGNARGSSRRPSPPPGPPLSSLERDGGGGGGGGTEWVEIIEPRTQEHMFANLTTGECVWDPPAGVPVKKTSDNQWWELFDQNTSRFYYYNATTQKTVWHRPANCDIIPLAKLQTLKQNTEVREEDDEGDSTTTSRKKKASSSSSSAQTWITELEPVARNGSVSSLGAASKKTRLTLSSVAQTSPANSPKAGRRHSHHHHRHQHPKLHHRRASDANAPDTAQPVPSHRRFLRDEEPVGGEDRRRTTIGPAQAKYYSVPSRGDPPPLPADRRTHHNSSLQQRQKSFEGRHHRQHQPPGADEDSPSPSSISRSASFMGGGGGGANNTSSSNTRVGAAASPLYSAPVGWKASLDSRRSTESAPAVSASGNRRGSKGSPESATGGANSSPAHSSIGSPIEGYCTPLINRKIPQRSRPGELPASQSPLRERMSISELVDTGLNTLTDDDNGDAGDHHYQNREKRVPASAAATAAAKAKPAPALRPHKLRRGAGNNGTLERPNKMSPLQQYILEQAKLSGYRFGDPVSSSGANAADGCDRDSYVESEDDWMDKQHEDSDFADDEDGGGFSDSLSKASSIDGDAEGERYLSEPTYNNLDPMWFRGQNHSTQSAGHVGGGGSHSHGQPQRPSSQQQHQFPPVPAPRQSLQRDPQHHPLPGGPPQSTSAADIDAFSQEFDLRMRFGGGGGGGERDRSGRREGGHSTMPRPASHQPTSSHNRHQHQPEAHLQQQAYAPYSQPLSQHHQNPAYPVPYEVLHPSLLRNSGSRSHHHQVVGHHEGGGGSVTGSMLSVSAAESDIERYALDNLNVQKRGLFRKKVSVKDLLSHTKESIRKPLTCVTDKALKKEAIEVFRLIQIYMGERRAKAGMTINSVAMDITGKGYSQPSLRDEIFVQLCKQTTENLSRESLRRGWELMAICLTFFPPSATFAPALQSYIFRHRDPSLDYPDVGKWPIHVQISHYAGICAKRLERIGLEGGRLKPRRATMEEIDQSRLQIFRQSMFGGTLNEAMEIQQERFPHRRLPWILTTLTDQILRLGGTTTEGIFRVPADLDEVNAQKGRVDQWEVPACVDCHTAASLLKLWFRELYEPLVPDPFYEDCVKAGEEDEMTSGGGTASASVVARLPDLNRDVLTYLIRFLQVFAGSEVAAVTKMDAANLGTVFAPNCLRCQSLDPSVILENTRKEMAFVKSLIVSLDTSAFENVL